MCVTLMTWAQQVWHICVTLSHGPHATCPYRGVPDAGEYSFVVVAARLGVYLLISSLDVRR